MFLRRFILFFLLAFPLGLGAQQLSPMAKVSLITVGTGDEIYTFFGHTAIWIYDPGLGIDKVYNYGTFDFRASGFYWNFLRGNLPYQLSTSPLDYPDPQYSLLEYWKSENRSVIEQVLNFTPQQKQRLFELMEMNARPENKTYQYRPYYDNCSTRPRDKVFEAAGDSIRLDERDTFLIGKSYRDWMNDYLHQSYWSRLGLNLALGYPIDRITTPNQSAYIPNNLLRMLDRARIIRLNGKSEKLVLQTNTLFEATPVETSFLWKSLFWIVMASPLIILMVRKNKIRPGGTFDRSLLFITGVFGVIHTLLWFGTNHGITEWNYSMFITSPFNVIAFVMLSRRPKWLMYYFIVAMVFVVAGTMLQFLFWKGLYGLLFLNITLFLRYRHLALYCKK
ncbi:hypothetical protein BWI96_05770 [Siphonobacter sp. SORGH_AS_0500]|uniref:lipoprotein N-acyltransferase Lnb domain-containing protein n=1 Tax=Siphonobacter sp. SORGH_AS_0500 TaxID=1864824 RepID=UPI000CB62C28|nr:DUF4105 domain-containing protein [Siphonobacter sp. SORGH_AS_0500]PKK37380.1 hypothetical protein BWI96_05770 [Siphonobacter sp. SORGH_AS_0500]